MSQLIIADFDGTFTDAEAEGTAFTLGCINDLAQLTGQSLEEVQERAVELFAGIARSPETYNWMYEDTTGVARPACSACVDPYLRIKPVAENILRANGYESVPGARMQDVHQFLYKKNYLLGECVFRPGAAELLCFLYGAAYVVTNSGTQAVVEKLEKIRLPGACGNVLASEAYRDRVYGSAKKYLIDPEFTLVDERMSIPGLHGREVELRRKLYHDVIADLMVKAGVADWVDVTVVGDIFELDLALPLAMGARVILLMNDNTPQYEVDFLNAHPRGEVVRSLEGVQQLLDV